MSKLREIIEAKQNGAYAHLNAADPTARKSYMPWLASLFLADRLLLEDLSKATTYLTLFHKYRNNLKQKQITDYKTLPALYNALVRFLPKVSEEEKAVSGLNGTASRDDVIELYRDSNLRVLIPLSHRLRLLPSCLRSSRN